MVFTSAELTLIKDALDILTPDNDDAQKRLEQLRDEIQEELFQNAEYD